MGRERRPRIAVLGAGAAGLSAAYEAHRKGAEVDVFEANDDVGGVLRSARISPADETSWAYDVGAASMTLKHAEVAKVVDLLDLAPIARSKDRRTTYVVHNGTTVPLPRSPTSLLTTPLLDMRTKLRVLCEPFVKPLEDKRKASYESVAAFFERRFSKQFAARVVDPAVAGIYGAAPDTLLMRYALPSVWKVEREKGSVIWPMLQRIRKSTPESKRLTESSTFADGMQSLPRALARTLNERSRVFTSTPVRRLRRRRDGTWRVNRRWDRYDAVICTVPAYVLPSIQTNIHPMEKAFANLASLVNYAPMAVTVLGYTRKAISHALDGVGVLVPGAESRHGLLGVQFSSEGFPSKSRADGENDMVFLTAYVGGARTPEFAKQAVADIQSGTVAEVNRLLGAKEVPTFSKVHVWENGIPQPGSKQDGVRAAVRRLERAVPGLIVAGNYVNGVGVPDAVLSGLNAAKRAQRYMEKMKSIIVQSAKEPAAQR